MPQVDGPDATFKLSETELPELKDGEILVKALYFSNDPAQRGWISPNATQDRLYAPMVKEGTPMHARALAEVVESKSDNYKKGDTVLANMGWSEFGIVPPDRVQPAPDLPGGMSKTHYVSTVDAKAYS